MHQIIIKRNCNSATINKANIHTRLLASACEGHDVLQRNWGDRLHMQRNNVGAATGCDKNIVHNDINFSDEKKKRKNKIFFIFVVEITMR